ncbi:MAG: hypothetical protein Q9213_002086 [Squamulea squamosa]
MNGYLPPPPYSLEDPSFARPASTTASNDLRDARNVTTFVSGAAYFEIRPPTHPRPKNTLPCHIAVLPSTVAAELPMPKPEQIMTDRHVTPHDWMTFVNHVVPYQVPKQITSSVQKTVDQKRPVGQTFPILPVTESQRQQDVRAVVQEWNQGFFLPRGIEIVVRLEIAPPARSSTGPSSSFVSVARPPAENTLARLPVGRKNKVKQKL